jgi:hypothetical protein
MAPVVSIDFAGLIRIDLFAMVVKMFCVVHTMVSQYYGQEVGRWRCSSSETSIAMLQSCTCW